LNGQSDLLRGGLLTREHDSNHSAGKATPDETLDVPEPLCFSAKNQRAKCPAKSQAKHADPNNLASAHFYILLPTAYLRLKVDGFGARVSALPYIELMATNPRRRSIKLLICPGCEEEGTLRKILYGMPDPETFDFEKYAVGGCCFNGDGSDPDISCRECDWAGFRDKDFLP
jgi:hypothetical protein